MCNCRDTDTTQESRRLSVQESSGRPVARNALGEQLAGTLQDQIGPEVDQSGNHASAGKGWKGALVLAGSVLGLALLLTGKPSRTR